MIHRLKEELLTETGDVLTLSTQEFEEQTPEDGYLHLAAFSYEDTPIWRFLVMVWRSKRDWNATGRNTVALHYESKPQQPECGICADSIFPVPYPREPDLSCRIRNRIFNKGSQWKVEGMTLHLRTNGMIKEIAETEEVYFLPL